ncbi:MAG: FtsB family cell division protein [Clostridia bacterium]
MKISEKHKKIIKKVMIVGVIAYTSYTFISQQQTLNAYKSEQNYYQQQINQEKENKEKLATIKENIDSTDYIEQVAREKLDMYLPNERVYIDISK